MKRALLCLTLLAIPANAAKRGEAPIVIPDSTNYTKGQFLGYLSPWGGTGGVDTMAVYPSAFPFGSVISWSWPATPCASVCGYMQMTYGNYDGGVPQTSVTPKQVKNIVTLDEEFTYSLTGDPTTFNVLNEFYLTSASGNENTRVIEIGWLLNASASAVSFFNSSTQIGTFTDRFGRQWKAASSPTGEAGLYVMILPVSGAQMVSGLVDMKGALTYLTAQGKITGNEWLNGLAIGVEPVQNSGKLYLSRWTIVFN